MDAVHDGNLAGRLASHLAAMEPGRVWRPVHAPDGTLLANGGGPSPQVLAGYLAGVDFAGKSVIDLGCNLGFYSFMAAKGGAASVLGLDSDLEAIEGARMLAELHGLANVRFETADFLKEEPSARADMVLGVDFIGRGVVAKGRLDDVLRAAVSRARREIVLSFHPVYPLEAIGPLPPDLARRYAARIRDGLFHLEQYVRDFVAPSYQGLAIHDGRVEGHALKAAFLFTSAAGT